MLEKCTFCDSETHDKVSLRVGSQGIILNVCQKHFEVCDDILTAIATLFDL